MVDKQENRKIIVSKWIFKIKPGIPGVEKRRHKARVVAKDHTQKEGIDYKEVFSQVVKHISIRTLFPVVVN